VEAIHASHKTLAESSFKVAGQLRVTVVEGRKLAVKDHRLIGTSSSDPFAILKIESQQHRTRTLYKTLNPDWNEEFSFHITQNQGMLFVLIFDEDVVTAHDSMGQVVFPLSGIPQGATIDHWFPVLPKKPHENISGEIRLKISYDSVKDEESSVPATDPVFGKTLVEICSNKRLCPDGDVPTFFTYALHHLEEKAIDSEGIFRISGSFATIKSIKQLVDEGKILDLDQYDVNSVAGALKLYLRELPVPVLTFENYDKIIELSSISNEKEAILQEKTLVAALPPPNRALLTLLIFSLRKFADNSKVNYTPFRSSAYLS